MQMINIDIWDLLNIAKNKKIVCFGAGKKLEKFLEHFEEYHIRNLIYCILDNDENKNGSVINICGSQLKVYSFKYFKESMKIENCVIVITSLYVCEILQQLNNFDQFKNIQCCYCDFIRAFTDEKEEEERYYPQNLKIFDKPIIPKKIHYCWFGENELPIQNRIWMESWKKYCPDYEIIEWNERNYDVKKNQYMYDAYKMKKWGFVSDYARLDIIYCHGGIYLDIDVELVKNLDELLYQEAFAGVEESKQINTGLGFGAVPHFHIIKDLRDSYDSISFDYDSLVACPTLNEDIFKNYHFVKNGNYQRLDGMAIYPEKVLSPKSNITGMVRPTKNTFSIHHYDGSWGTAVQKERIKKIQILYRELIS